MKDINYVVWQEDKYFVSQCLNVEVSSFGDTIQEAINNLKEALELYFEGENKNIPVINTVLIGKEAINA